MPYSIERDYCPNCQGERNIKFGFRAVCQYCGKDITDVLEEQESTNSTRETFWMKGSGSQGDGMHACFSSFWKMLCYRDNCDPVTGEKIGISYAEYSEGD